MRISATLSFLLRSTIIIVARVSIKLHLLQVSGGLHLWHPPLYKLLLLLRVAYLHKNCNDLPLADFVLLLTSSTTTVP